MSKVSIIIPVIRPKNLADLVSLIRATAGIPEEEYEILAEEDVKRIGAPKMVKKLVEESQYDNVMFIGDDCLPHRDFVKNALKAMDELPGGWGLVGLNDMQRPAHHPPTHWLASKKLLKYCKEFFHTGYIHQYCDNELHLWAEGLDHYVRADDAMIFHDHVGFIDKKKSFAKNVAASNDEDIKRVYSYKVRDHDKALFDQRKKMILLTVEDLKTNDPEFKTTRKNMKFTGERVVIGDMKSYIPTLQEHLARYNFALQPALNKTVLDAACGTGYGSKLLTEAAKSVVGADVSAQAIKYASGLYPEVDFMVKDLNTEFPVGKFDLCVSFETIEHLENPEVFLQNVSAHCKEFLFSIPVNNPSKYHLQVWSEEDIVKMMEKHWTKIDWFHQTGYYIFEGKKDSTFLIGYATK